TTSELHIDNSGNTGGTTFTVGGTLTNTNFFGIGNGGAIGTTTVTAAGLSNTGRITLGNGGGAAGMATLDVATAAGFGTAGVLSGEVDLGSNALLKFTSGQITQVANGGTLFITGTKAHLANVSDLTTNSALTGLTTNNGRIFLEN